MHPVGEIEGIEEIMQRLTHSLGELALQLIPMSVVGIAEHHDTVPPGAQLLYAVELIWGIVAKHHVPYFLHPLRDAGPKHLARTGRQL